MDTTHSLDSPESVDVELLGDVVLAVGVLKGEVELVVLVEHVEAVARLGAGALLCAARAIDINLQADKRG